MDECKIILMGFGAVGKGVAKAISLKKGMIDEKYGIEFRVRMQRAWFISSSV